MYGLLTLALPLGQSDQQLVGSTEGCLPRTTYSRKRLIHKCLCTRYETKITNPLPKPIKATLTLTLSQSDQFSNKGYALLTSTPVSALILIVDTILLVLRSDITVRDSIDGYYKILQKHEHEQSSTTAVLMYGKVARVKRFRLPVIAQRCPCDRFSRRSFLSTTDRQRGFRSRSRTIHVRKALDQASPKTPPSALVTFPVSKNRPLKNGGTAVAQDNPVRNQSAFYIPGINSIRTRNHVVRQRQLSTMPDADAKYTTYKDNVGRF